MFTNSCKISTNPALARVSAQTRSPDDIHYFFFWNRGIRNYRNRLEMIAASIDVRLPLKRDWRWKLLSFLFIQRFLAGVNLFWSWLRLNLLFIYCNVNLIFQCRDCHWFTKLKPFCKKKNTSSWHLNPFNYSIIFIIYLSFLNEYIETCNLCVRVPSMQVVTYSIGTRS